MHLVAVDVSRSRDTCRALAVRQETTRVVSQRSVARHPSRYAIGAAFSVRRRGLSCADVERILTSVLPAKDEAAALRAAGLGITGFARVRYHGQTAYRIRAGGNGIALSYMRLRHVRIDHSVYRAGQELRIFAGIDPGDQRARYVPCTASFAAVVPGLPGPVGLTAGHCLNNVTGDPTSVTRAFSAAAQFSPLGIVLNRVGDGTVGTDALTFSVFFNWAVAQQIERGERLPLTVTGVATPPQMAIGRPVCFAGRATGADQCGRIIAHLAGMPAQLTCTDIAAHPGDSGGPVYIDPGNGVTTRAVGIVSRARRHHGHNMCFTPITAALDALGATVAQGPLVRAAHPDQIGIF